MAIPKIFKRKLTGSTGGRQVKVTGVASPGQTVHTAYTTVSTPGNFDEVWMWATNVHTAAALLTIEFGGTVNPDDRITVNLPADAGPILVVPGLVLQGGLLVKAFAAVANVVLLSGYVNQVTE